MTQLSSRGCFHRGGANAQVAARTFGAIDQLETLAAQSEKFADASDSWEMDDVFDLVRLIVAVKTDFLAEARATLVSMSKHQESLKARLAVCVSIDN